MKVVLLMGSVSRTELVEPCLHRVVIRVASRWSRSRKCRVEFLQMG